jgi:hypothetical protein
MKNLLFALVLGLAFPLSLPAQTTQENPPGRIQQDSQPASLASSVNQGEKKISGCLRQEKEKFALENAYGKKIWLSGPENFASHVGHKVTLSGNFSTTSASSNSSAHRSNQGTDFQVTKMEMVSPTCEIEKSKGSKSQNQH